MKVSCLYYLPLRLLLLHAGAPPAANRCTHFAARARTATARVRARAQRSAAFAARRQDDITSGRSNQETVSNPATESETTYR